MLDGFEGGNRWVVWISEGWEGRARLFGAFAGILIDVSGVGIRIDVGHDGDGCGGVKTAGLQ